MIEVFRHTIRFVMFVLAQALIFNQLEIGFGIQFLIYPLFIMLLPWNLNIYIALLVSFALGLSIDSLSNTYGLHASSALMIAYLRPYFFKMFEPRDGYEQFSELSSRNMSFGWTFYVQGLLLLIHHFWFFLIEIFKFNEMFFVLQKTALSVPCSFFVGLLIQQIFNKRLQPR